MLVSYSYPPISSPGSLRLSKHSQYLPDHGWRPIVLTSRDGFNPGGKPLPVPGNPLLHIERAPDPDPLKRAARDGARLSEGPRDGIMQRWAPIVNQARRAYSSLAFPDRDWLWLPSAQRSGRRLLRRPGLGVSLIYSTSPNMTNHLVALSLRRSSGLPWVAEFRDLWAGSSVRPARSKMRAAAERRLERRVCERADHLVFVSEDNRQRFVVDYGLPWERTSVIPNGFDPADFSMLPAAAVFPRFSIAHAGFLYDGQRDPSCLFAALRGLADAGSLTLQEVQIDFYGRFDPTVHGRLAECGLESRVRWHGYLAYEDLLPRLRRAYCLLLVLHRSNDMLPAKLFDYMGCGRPVIAVCPPDSAAGAIVCSTGIGAVVDHDDVEGMKRVLLAHWQRWKQGDPQSTQVDASALRMYTRPYQAGQLAALFDQVWSNGPGTSKTAGSLP
jgi:glycosyltransferase involved in cell wall biosynthesis